MATFPVRRVYFKDEAVKQSPIGEERKLQSKRLLNDYWRLHAPGLTKRASLGLKRLYYRPHLRFCQVYNLVPPRSIIGWIREKVCFPTLIRNLSIKLNGPAVLMSFAETYTPNIRFSISPPCNPTIQRYVSSRHYHRGSASRARCTGFRYPESSFAWLLAGSVNPRIRRLPRAHVLAAGGFIQQH